MKGQLNLEYLAAATIFLATIGSIFLYGDSLIPHFQSPDTGGEKYMEARQVSDSLINMEGESDWWETNNDNPSHVGLSNGSKYHLDREKINALGGDFSYSDFLSSTDTDNQFRLIFDWLPTTTLPVDFRKERPGEAGISDMPDLAEDFETDPRYGNITLGGETYHLISVFSPPGFEENPLFISDNRDSDYLRYNTNNNDDSHIEVDGEPLKVEEVYQGEDARSSMVVFGQEINTFGPETDSNVDSVRMERVAVLEGHPIRIGVVAW